MGDKKQAEADVPQKEIDAAAEEALRLNDPGDDVRQWLLTTETATLCTISAKPEFAGFPFGSIVPFAVDAEGRPFIMIANIAAHTANLRQDPRATLFVSDPLAEGDPQNSWRIGVMGSMQRILAEGTKSRHLESAQVVDSAAYADLHARYVERVPGAEGYLGQHSFDYWRMNEIKTVRYIAGFGRICWVEGSRVLREPLSAGLREAAQPAIVHMNKDHAENMVEMCAGHYGFRPASARMIALDRTGFQVVTENPSRNLHFSFGCEINSESLRHAVIKVLRKAREAQASRAKKPSYAASDNSSI